MKRLIKATTIYNIDSPNLPDNPINGWGPIFKMSDADAFTYQYLFNGGEEVGHIETWDDDGDWAIVAYDSNDRNLGTFETREQARTALENSQGGRY